MIPVAAVALQATTSSLVRSISCVSQLSMIDRIAPTVMIAVIRASRAAVAGSSRRGESAAPTIAARSLIERARCAAIELPAVKEAAGGAPIEGDIGLQDDKFQVYVTLFADGASARQAEIGLRAKPTMRAAESRGASAIRTDGRVVYVANGRGGALDDFRLDDVVRVVGVLPPEGRSP